MMEMVALHTHEQNCNLITPIATMKPSPNLPTIDVSECLLETSPFAPPFVFWWRVGGTLQPFHRETAAELRLITYSRCGVSTHVFQTEFDKLKSDETQALCNHVGVACWDLASLSPYRIIL
jgi:hypothetical protein